MVVAGGAPSTGVASIGDLQMRGARQERSISQRDECESEKLVLTGWLTDTGNGRRRDLVSRCLEHSSRRVEMERSSRTESINDLEGKSQVGRRKPLFMDCWWTRVEPVDGVGVPVSRTLSVDSAREIGVIEHPQRGLPIMHTLTVLWS